MDKKVVLFDGLLYNIGRLFKKQATVNNNVELISCTYGQIHTYGNMKDTYLVGWKHLPAEIKNNIPDSPIATLVKMFKPKLTQEQKNDLKSISKVFDYKTVLPSDLVLVALYNLEKLTVADYFRNYFGRSSFATMFKKVKLETTDGDLISVNTSYKLLKINDDKMLLIFEQYNPNILLDVILSSVSGPSKLPNVFVYVKNVGKLYFFKTKDECSFVDVEQSNLSNTIKTMLIG